MCLRIELF
ncbi:hypothetical protein Bhyg_12662 [Pseudolycoriella hygida]|uniref:Uncharacterized protein n=1 Tax=Pseudolycoriella hygida TaxID=35572 RepID=A0A9Q0RZJ1_9DIPT|nr:hypothetical protein Bhyg_12662 [Pseudolycoriella hygida]